MSQTEYQREWYQKNRERLLAKGRERYRTDNRRIRARQRRYELAHKTEIAARKKVYRAGKYVYCPIGTCPICKRESVKLHQDHDHTNGKLRDLVCINCNIALGHARDSRATLKAMREYLEKHGIDW